MRKQFWFLVAGLLAAPASADYACPTGADDADVLFDKAEGLVAAGQDAAAFALLRRVDAICFDSGDKQAKRARFDTMIETVGRKLAKAAEAATKFDEAERIYVDVRNSSYAYTEADEDRVVMARLRANRSSLDVVRGAAYRFNAESRRMWSETSQRDRAKLHQAERAQQMAAHEAEVRSIAAAQGDAALAAEAREFASQATSFGRYPLAELDRAITWYELADPAAMQRAKERAIARGDALMTEDIVLRLAGAIEYYNRAQAADKVGQVRNRAKQLGDAADKAGNYQKAAEFYNVAELDDLAESVMARGEAQSKAAEKKRKAAFEAGMDDLEAELGL